MPFHYIVPSHSTTLDSLYVCAAMCRLLIYLLTYLVSYVLNSIFMFCKKKEKKTRHRRTTILIAQVTQ